MSEANVVVVTCKMCHGGENGEKTACLSSIRSIIENGDVAFMMYSGHVKEKIEALGYKLIYRYADNDNQIPIGMWIMQS